MKFLKNIFLFMAATLISLLFCELLLSFLNPVNIRSDPKWVSDGYTRGHYRPNQEITGSIGHNVRNPYHRSTTAKYKLNSFGYRGNDWDLTVPNNIAFFGGSSTFSFHDDDNDAWPYVTTSCLNARDKLDFQSLNFSHPGYSIFDAPHILLQKASHFDIDWIITYHLWNDIKFIRAIAENPNYLFSTSVAKSEFSLKSILLDLRIFPNLLGNINLVHRRFFDNISENLHGMTHAADITLKNIDNALLKIHANYESLIKLSPSDRKFLFIKQGLLLDKDNDSFDREIGWELIGLNKEQFLYVQEAYYSMLDTIALENVNVFLFDADKIIPKNLKMYEDHVHLQRAAQSILGKQVCDYVKQHEGL